MSQGQRFQRLDCANFQQVLSTGILRSGASGQGCPTRMNLNFGTIRKKNGAVRRKAFRNRA